MNFTNVIDYVQINERLKKIVVSLEKIQTEVLSNCLLANVGSSYFVTKMQADQSLNWHDSIDQLLYGTIIDHCVRAEKVAAGSFFSTLSIIIKSIKQKSNFISKKDFELIIESAFLPTYQQFQDHIYKTINDEAFGSIVLQVLELVGLEGKIFFEESNNDITSIELVNGYNFKVTFPFQVKNYKKKDVKCLIVDGLVESVSEIHHLLQKFSETQEDLVFVARGFSKDVINTLKINYDRLTLKILPVIVPFDFDGVNMLGDIAIVCGTDITSSMKGQLISTIKYEDIIRVSMISCSGDILTIENNSTLKQAQVQVQKLIIKRKEAPIEDLGRIFDSRIKSLTPNCTKIRIPASRMSTEYTEKFDVVIRLVRSIIKRGLFSKHRLHESSMVIDCLPDETTTDAAIVSLQYAKSCCWMLQRAGAVIA